MPEQEGQQMSLNSELQALNSPQLRKVIQHLCSEDAPSTSQLEKTTLTTTLEFITALKQRAPKEQTRPIEQTPSPASSTLNPPPSKPQAAESPRSTHSHGSGSSNSRRTRDFDPRALQDLFGLNGLQPLQRCGRCRSWFTESHNTQIACTFHPGRVHFQDADQLAYVPTIASCDARYVPSAFRWTCCGDVVGTSSGCANDRHDAHYHGRGGIHHPEQGRRALSARWQIRGEHLRTWYQ
ncbi:hypothetical protein F5Y15DRAFT_414272 [Xylariaceae sp. FL0016]|nr:hypothetical protein F5Y15DRAFT_414272 [Xylariaceae sp. FL0016]